ncbi:thioredoxin [Treponema endosymbiont of Eucomonympha sp.]|uniref:thioredoxin n=2 Tax=Treponema endosymbiont of Eucomonympha sp. TaxID=1580831 RepID=UPI0007518D15|nr:thioredoxin [Treponema endosymbiont of Eucomonympha sp.]
MAVQLTAATFDAEVLQSTEPVLVDFWAPWCGPCRSLAPVIEEIAASQSGIKVGKINVDEEPSLAERFDVQSIPTVMLFKGGQEVKRSVGSKTKAELLAFFE